MVVTPTRRLRAPTAPRIADVDFSPHTFHHTTAPPAITVTPPHHTPHTGEGDTCYARDPCRACHRYHTRLLITVACGWTDYLPPTCVPGPRAVGGPAAPPHHPTVGYITVTRLRTYDYTTCCPAYYTPIDCSTTHTVTPACDGTHVYTHTTYLRYQ